MKIDEFIESIRETSHFTPFIYTNGDCYKFSKLLQKIYPNGKIFAIKDTRYSTCSHAVFFYEDDYWDINGRVSLRDFQEVVEINESLLEIYNIESWSTERNNFKIIQKSLNRKTYKLRILSAKSIAKLKLLFDDEEFEKAVKTIDSALVFDSYIIFMNDVALLAKLMLNYFYILFIFSILAFIDISVLYSVLVTLLIIIGVGKLIKLFLLNKIEEHYINKYINGGI